MTTLLSILFLAPALFGWLAEPLAAELETLKGEVHQGVLAGITADHVTLKVDAADLTVPVSEALDLRFPTARPPLTAPPPVLMTLTDGTRLSGTNYTVARSQVTLQTEHGPLTVQGSTVAHVRLMAATETQLEAFRAIVARESKDDTLVSLTKDGTLNRLSGIVGDIGEKVQFLLDGDDLQVKREKIFGIVYRRREATRRPASIQVTLLGGDQWQAKQVTLDGQTAKVQLAVGPELSLPVELLKSVDYSAGKVRYLSQDDPRDLQAVHVWGGAKVDPHNLPNYFRRDRSRSGPLSIGGIAFRRGLHLFPDTTIRYRLGAEYTRFKAGVGIDDEVAEGWGNARLKILGDSKVLFEGDIKNGEKLLELDLDVAEVRDLLITVTSGADKLDSGDFVDLVNARVLK